MPHALGQHTLPPPVNPAKAKVWKSGLQTPTSSTVADAEPETEIGVWQPTVAKLVTVLLARRKVKAGEMEVLHEVISRAWA